MFKPSVNPTIEELTKSHRERQYPLGYLKSIKLADGTKQCIWCLTTLSGQKRKWCSENCSNMAMAWGYPQSEFGLHVLLARQDFKCNACAYSYMPEIEKAVMYLNRNHKTIDPSKLYTDIRPILMKILKQRVPRDRTPEVDHVIPISKGGPSLGLDNHNCLCYLCHKTKTRIDNSGPRKR